MFRAHCLALFALSATLSFAQDAFLTRPTINGDRVAFTAEGDLWVGSLSSGETRRLTTDPGLETNASFSPDGKWIAFTGQYDSGNDVYLMPAEGGAPKRLTYDPKTARVLGWTPDGRSIIFRSNREAPFAEQRLYTVPVEGGPAKKIAVPRGQFASMNAQGQLVYVPVSWEWANWYRYRGGGADDLWLADLRSGSFKQLTTDLGVDTTPVWCGEAVYFVSERSGASNLWKLDPATKAAKQVSKVSEGAVRYPASDGRRVIFQAGTGLAVYDPQTGETSSVRLKLNSDRIHTRSQVAPLSTWASNSAIGPTGKRVAIEARGQIVSVGAENGDMRVLDSKAGARAMFPAWSPDGKLVAYISDRSGENELWVVEAQGGEPRQLTRGMGGHLPNPPLWSPDGKWIAMADREARMMLVDSATGALKIANQGGLTGSYDTFQNFAFSPDSKFLTFDQWAPNWTRTVFLYEIATGRLAQAAPAMIDAFAPSFDATGKLLLYLAETNLAPSWSSITGKIAYDNTTRAYMVALGSETSSPFLPKNDEEGPAPEAKDAKPDSSTVVDWDGLLDRVIEVPVPAARFNRIEGVTGRLLLGSSANPSSMSGGSTFQISAFDIDKRSLTTIVSGIQRFQVSSDRKKVLVVSGSGLNIIDAASGPTTLTAGSVNLAPYTITIAPESEWKQVFEESWRIARDFFYDPGMHGMDWNAIRLKYRAMLPKVGSRPDLTQLIKDMVSELNTGHAYVGAPTLQKPNTIAFLGADYQPVPGADAVKITKLYKGDSFSPGVRSPLLDPGLKIKVGDHILAVNGRRVSRDEDFSSLMQGLRGQTIALTVNTAPSMGGSRTVRVRPLSSEDAMRYQDWVEGRAAYVRQHGGENFGYAHITNMGAEGWIGFTKGHFPNVLKDAVIYDTRFNGGGNVSSLIIENLNLSPQQWWKPRYGGYWTRESWAPIGYIAAVCNEGNFSDGELFIDTWKRLKLGPVVGKRTGGGEVGSGGGYTLVDGGWLYIPNYAGFAGKEWLIEGRGATPDYEVEQDPALVMAGRDPQLDKAIELLKGMLKRNPIVRPVHPPFPKKTGGSDGG